METIKNDDIPQFKKQVPEAKNDKSANKTGKHDQYKNAEKEEPILGLDPNNKDNLSKVPLKTID